MEKIKLKPPARLAFIGLGAMGLPMAARLKSAGYKLNVHNRDRKKEINQSLQGVKACESPAKAAEEVKAFLICVKDNSAVNNILFGSNGAEKHLKAGCIIIDFSTIDPSEAVRNANKLKKNNLIYIDAPVSGGTEGAKKGNLTVLAGGENNALELVMPILKVIGNDIYHFGNSGSGQKVKALNQILVAGTYAAVAEALNVGKNLNLPMDLVVEALGKGAASSWPLKYRSKSIINEYYPLGFKLSLHHKDLIIALKIAEEIGIKLPITNKVKEMEEDLIKNGYENEDISAIGRLTSKS